MTRASSGSPVPRHTVFILADGNFVVQWDENRVQDLLSGQYRSYKDADFGHSITDYELNQLKIAGRVEHYNGQFVWLYALPEHGRFLSHQQYSGPARVRSFYLNTTLPEDHLTEVRDALQALHLDHDFLARVRGGLVAVLGKNGAPFLHLQDAERAQKLLVSRAPDLFQHTAIAFVETSDDPYTQQMDYNAGEVDLGTIILSQTDTSITEGKRVLVVSDSEDEQTAMQQLFTDMAMDVFIAVTAAQSLQMLEDQDPDLLIIHTPLPDMHVWEILAKIKEIGTFQHTLKLMIANHQATSDDQAFALTVGKVDGYLVRPVSMAQLRQHVWLMFKNQRESAE